MSLYNTTNLTGATNLYEQAVGVNQLVGNMYGLGIIISVAIITFSWVKRQGDAYAALQSSMWISLFIGTLLLPINLITFDIYKYILIICGMIICINLLFKET